MANSELKRTAKGKRPQYFADPATDKLLSITLTLAQEVSVLRDRLDTIERLLETRDILSSKAIDEFIPTEAVAAQRETCRQHYLARILRAVQMELEEVSDQSMPKSLADVFKQMD